MKDQVAGLDPWRCVPFVMGAFLLTCVWFWQARQEAVATVGESPPLQPASGRELSEATLSGDPAMLPVLEADAFQLFAAPLVAVDAATGDVRLRSRRQNAQRSEGEAGTLRLLAVVRGPFRWQFVGYLGEAGQYRGLFRDQLTGETQTAAPGSLVGGDRFQLLRLTVERRLLDRGEASGTVRAVAIAQWRCVRSGDTFVTSTDGTDDAGPPRARIELTDTAGVVELGLADELDTSSGRWRVEALSEAPPWVRLRLVSPDGQSSERVLQVTTVDQ